jgi:hypothetical protein
MITILWWREQVNREQIFQQGKGSHIGLTLFSVTLCN